MDYKKALESFRKHGFEAVYFDTAEEAKRYLAGEIHGETVGFGGSVTCEQLGLYELLGQDNTVLWHWKNKEDRQRYPEFTVYLTSANGVSETGELVNIDGSGNRLSASLYGPKRVYFICGVNKLAPSLEAAITRARQIAAPANAKRLGCKTPCATLGRCIDCNSPGRICRAMSIHMRPLNGARHTVVLIGEELGM
ncbi:MAG: lactate utilization protein [Oscillospiraceae bacterium]|nr:MAG: lactate utilization protein [Oscillospiraceae bacterium]